MICIRQIATYHLGIDYSNRIIFQITYLVIPKMYLNILKKSL